MIYEFLESNGIEYQRIDHPPVFTCEEAKRLVPQLAGAETKNLFLRDGKGRQHFLVAVRPEKDVDLRALSISLGTKGLGFASPDRLQRYLGIEPGSVTLLAALNDTTQAVEIIIDEDLWREESLLCHPLVNTSTLLLSKVALISFLNLTRHAPRVLVVPSKI